MLIILLLVSICPLIAIAIFFKCTKLKINFFVFLASIASGVVATIFAALLQGAISDFSFEGRLKIFFDVFVRISLTEELMRFLMLLVLFFCLKKIMQQFKPEKAFAIALGLVAGLAFALVETALIAAANSEATILRIFTAAPLHAACGGYCAIAAFNIKSSTKNIRPFFSAVILHSFYNAMLPVGKILSVLAVALTIMSLIKIINAYFNALKHEVCNAPCDTN